jgi:polar amino acid transport system substrate-binding protein
MVPYFAVEGTGQLEGVIPDLGRELARRLGVPCDLVRIKNPAGMIAAFRAGAADATFIGITAERAAAIDFGPVVIGIQTTFLVPGQSAIKTITDVDNPRVRIAVPQDSAQAAELGSIITKARLMPVPAERPAQAIAMLASDEADAFSHVAPMLASVQGSLPGARILPGSYFDVPIAVGSAKGLPPAAAAFCQDFAADVQASGFVGRAIARMGESARGLVNVSG